jgi:hypothetical protein
MVTDVDVLRNVEVVHRGQREVVDILGIWCEWKTTEGETNHHYFYHGHSQHHPTEMME